VARRNRCGQPCDLGVSIARVRNGVPPNLRWSGPLMDKVPGSASARRELALASPIQWGRAGGRSTGAISGIT
jgi:hypothetical protein